MHPTPSAACSYSVPCLLFSFVSFVGQWVSLSRGLFLFIPGVAVGIPHATYLLTVGLLDASQAGLEPASASAEAPLFSQYNVAQRSFRTVWGVQGVEALMPLSAFFLPSVALAFQ
jgi:hypothetical protein